MDQSIFLTRTCGYFVDANVSCKDGIIKNFEYCSNQWTNSESAHETTFGSFSESIISLFVGVPILENNLVGTKMDTFDCRDFFFNITNDYLNIVAQYIECERGSPFNFLEFCLALWLLICLFKKGKYLILGSKQEPKTTEDDSSKFIQEQKFKSLFIKKNLDNHKYECRHLRVYLIKHYDPLTFKPDLFVEYFNQKEVKKELLQIIQRHGNISAIRKKAWIQTLLQKYKCRLVIQFVGKSTSKMDSLSHKDTKDIRVYPSAIPRLGKKPQSFNKVGFQNRSKFDLKATKKLLRKMDY